jgi:hypothetical protein
VAGNHVALGDRIDMTDVNSTVTGGRGELGGHDGMATEAGQISGMLAT